MESTQITPEPDEAEREAILTALAEEAAERLPISRWNGGYLPDHEDGEP